jgi:hypothetical protein
LNKQISFAAGLLLAASASFAQVTVSSPANNSTVGSPTQFVASARSTSGAPITAMRIYVDNNTAYTTGSASLNTSLNLNPGGHYVVVQAWDSNGQVYKTPLNINVSGTSSGTSIPSNAQVFSNIDQMTGWQSCNTCAGPGGKGASVPYSMTQFRSSPSMDGQSAQFWLGGSTPYSAALWWKQLGARSYAANFVYDLYFYMDNPSASQALEFDVNQSVNGMKFIFGTECNIKGTHQWDIWDGSGWKPTGVGCAQPSAYQWHHLTWEFKRSGNWAVFVSVTLDGRKSYINTGFQVGGSGVQELNTAFQMDGDYAEHNYSTWLDKISLYYW